MWSLVKVLMVLFAVLAASSAQQQPTSQSSVAASQASLASQQPTSTTVAPSGAVLNATQSLVSLNPSATPAAGCNVNTTNAGGCTDQTNAQPCSSLDSIPGSFQFTAPTMNTIVTVGSNLTISWGYSSNTDRTKFPAKNIGIYVALINSNGNQPVYNLIAKINPNLTTFNWNSINQTQTGQYSLRLVADDLDPLKVVNGQVPCYSSGFPLPTISNAFRIVQSDYLPSYPDGFGPNSGSARILAMSVGLISAISLLLAVQLL
ncbi:uncharacterized protein BJ171DRAFT_509120 [Polychytrium aggregatum]|uniref:uncharacterized protein n=1 Tax=Polychytrium aggregatum TaxID=110093 RepID=UPI0022FDFE5C|nr:uncharacterized protein BJ171DRAFT_509120 [Polychytrium aggregatum]KAI9203626.1 hypothetical protein BJ171DRAFT_509120 [Polychytrium aggregatum]